MSHVKKGSPEGSVAGGGGGAGEGETDQWAVDSKSPSQPTKLPSNSGMSGKSTWDPLQDKESDVLTATASVRIKRDLVSLFNDPPTGIFVVGDESNLKFVHALIVGPEGTPYEGGFFYFILKFPNDYPIQPPKVKLMTTDAGRVRFNPNFYNNGKVCVSILGTWEGPAWSPAQQLSSVLITIQSLMTENPYFNEPGFVTETRAGDAKAYKNYVQYHTLRAAVCGMVENDCRLNMPSQLRSIMEKLFLNSYELYVELAEKFTYLNGSLISEIFPSRHKYPRKYEINKLLDRLSNIKEKLMSKKEVSSEDG